VYLDSPKPIVKAVILHRRNDLPSVPIGHESYGNMKLLIFIQYKKYSWSICDDLKVTALLFGMQLVYTKNLLLK
jgi:hypothetical protein